jgi:hypothetical protein
LDVFFLEKWITEYLRTLQDHLAPSLLGYPLNINALVEENRVLRDDGADGCLDQLQAHFRLRHDELALRLVDCLDLSVEPLCRRGIR